MTAKNNLTEDTKLKPLLHVAYHSSPRKKKKVQSENVILQTTAIQVIEASTGITNYHSQDCI